jgi:predicted  nucleic acid-binding Zn-ribbon protein
LKEQLELLWELQKIDLNLKGVEEGRDRYPKELKRLDEKHKIETERIQQEKEKIEALEKERRGREGRLVTEQEKVKRAEGRMFEIKTNKEYQALLAEIEMIKASNSREEEEVLRVLEEIDEVKKNLAKREKEVAANLEKIEAEKKRIQEKMALDAEGYKKHMERREILVKQLESKLYRLYSTLKERRRNVSVVRVINETCQGCFLNIPPQLFIEVQRNNALIQCPHCSRILYWEGDGRGG